MNPFTSLPISISAAVRRLLFLLGLLGGWSALLPAQSWEEVRLETFTGADFNLTNVADLTAAAFQRHGYGAGGAPGDYCARGGFLGASYLAFAAELSSAYEYRFSWNLKATGAGRKAVFRYAAAAGAAGTDVSPALSVPQLGLSQPGQTFLSDVFGGLDGTYHLILAPGAGNGGLISTQVHADDFRLERRPAAAVAVAFQTADLALAEGGSAQVCLTPAEAPAAPVTAAVSLASPPSPHFDDFQPPTLTFPAGSTQPQCFSLTTDAPNGLPDSAFLYTFTLAVTGGPGQAGAPAALKVTVTDDAPPCPGFAGADRTVCSGEAFTLGCEPVDSLCYKWEPENWVDDPHAAQPLGWAIDTTPFIVYVTDDDGNLIDIDTVVVNVLPYPSANLGEMPLTLCRTELPGVASPGEGRQKQLANCPGSTLTLDAGPEFSSYEWSNGSTAASINVSLPGNYSVTVTDEFGCAGVSYALVEEDYCLDIGITASQDSLCPGGSVTLTADGGLANYTWQDSTLGAVFVADTTGVFTVEAAGPDGCLGQGTYELANYEVEIQPLRAGLCEGDTLTLAAPPFQNSYLWNTGAGESSIAISETGSYSVTVSNAQGCTLDAAVEIQDCCQPIILHAGNLYSAGDTITLDPDSVQFGIVFLEAYELWHGFDYTWEIGNNVYKGGQIALRVRDFFPGGDFSPSITPIYVRNEGCNWEVSLYMDWSLIEVDKFEMPEKMNFFVYDRSSPPFQDITENFNSISNIAKDIFQMNGIGWIEYLLLEEDIGTTMLPNFIDGKVDIFDKPGIPPGNSQQYRYTALNEKGYDESSVNENRVWGLILAHETLHQILNRLGYLLFGNPRYFQPKLVEGIHIDIDNPFVKDFGINLNVEGAKLYSLIPEGGNDPLNKIGRIYPTQLYYVTKFIDFFYLESESLFHYLTDVSPDGEYIPHYNLWRTLEKRMANISRNLGVSTHFKDSPFSSFDQQNFLTQNGFSIEE